MPWVSSFHHTIAIITLITYSDMKRIITHLIYDFQYMFKVSLLFTSRF